jgi:hypothetical protein
MDAVIFPLLVGISFLFASKMELFPNWQNQLI